MAIELCLCESLLFERLQNVYPLDEYFSLFVFGIIKIALGPQDRTRTHVGLSRTKSPVGSFVAFCSSLSVPAAVYTVATNIDLYNWPDQSYIACYGPIITAHFGY